MGGQHPSWRGWDRSAVASTATAWRVIDQVACDESGLAGIRAAHAHARGRAWAAGAYPDANRLLVDADGTLLEAHSDKQGAAGTYKHGFGFDPLVCFPDRQDGTGEALAGLLRPGNAGSNTAADHIEVTDLALAQLPATARDQPIVVRADIGRVTHAFTDHLRQRSVGSSISLPADERVRPRLIAGSSHPSDHTGHPSDPGSGLQLELVHGDHTVRPPSLLWVATAAASSPSQRLVPLRRLLGQDVVADRLAAHGRRWRIGWFKAPDEHTVGGSQLLTIPINGQPHQFALLQEGLVQVARVELPGHVVTVHARRWPIQTWQLVMGQRCRAPPAHGPRQSAPRRPRRKRTPW